MSEVLQFAAVCDGAVLEAVEEDLGENATHEERVETQEALSHLLERRNIHDVALHLGQRRFLRMAPAEKQRGGCADSDHHQRQHLTECEVNEGPGEVPKERRHPLDGVGAVVADRNGVLLRRDVLQVVSPEELAVDGEQQHQIDEEESAYTARGQHRGVMHGAPMKQQHIERDVEVKKGAQVDEEVEEKGEGIAQRRAVCEQVVEEAQVEGNLQPEIPARQEEKKEVEDSDHSSEEAHREVGLAEAEHDGRRETVAEDAYRQQQRKQRLMQLAYAWRHVDRVVQARAGNGEGVN